MIGSRLGPYEITGKLGEGGMGEVYRATDTRLKREVAIKVLPEAFTEDQERLSRFEREAQLLAQLHHPNIASIFGVEESGADRALVMELVEGQTLAERLERGALPVDECLAIARQIAEALEVAHEKGIVHRDLKPANVVLTADGKVKVLDFGLAKALDPTAAASGASSASQLAASPTLTLAATVQGVILGTAGYMAPEQAKGVGVDKRADIWAFGVLVWEMLTGRRLFLGDSVPDVLAAVLRSEIELAAVPPDTPAEIRTLLRRCLERSPRNRLHDIADARLEIDAALAGSGEERVLEASGSSRSRTGLLVLAGVALGAAVGALTAWVAKPAPARPRLKLALAAPPEVEGFRIAPQISPDGRSMAYLADGRLWVQELDGLTPRRVPKSEGATALTWSPDSRALAFAARSEIWRTLPNGDVSLVTALTDAISSGGGGVAWTVDDEIVFSTGNSGLFVVPVTGGTPRVLLEPDRPKETDFHDPFALPDGRGIVFVVHRAAEGIDTVGILSDGRRRTLYQKEKMWFQSLAWSESGHLLVGASGSNSGVWAIPVRLSDVAVVGEPFLIAANTGAPSVSREGALLLSNVSSVGHHQLTLIDRAGERRAPVGEPVSHADHPTFSPDGTHVAVCVFETKSQSIWVHDLVRNSRSRLWSNVGCGSMAGGIGWAPDGQRLLISDSLTGTVRMRRADGSDEDVAVVEGTQPDLAPDGRTLVFTRVSEEGNKDLWVATLDVEGSAQPFLATAATEEQPQISPDGRFVAYVSNETGREEVHLRPFPQGNGQWQVSAEGGQLPRWSNDGRHLYFVQADDLVMDVEVKLGAVPLMSDPKPMFAAAAHRVGPDHGFDVSPDGETIVTVGFGSETSAGGDLTLILPWPPPTAD